MWVEGEEAALAGLTIVAHPRGQDSPGGRHEWRALQLSADEHTLDWRQPVARRSVLAWRRLDAPDSQAIAGSLRQLVGQHASFTFRLQGGSLTSFGFLN